MLVTFHNFFSDCHLEKSWTVNQSVLGVKEQSRGTIIFKNIGENETADLEQNSINLNDGNLLIMTLIMLLQSKHNSALNFSP